MTAFVSLRPGAQPDEQEIIDHVRTTLGAHKVPKSVHFIESIPKSAVAKILRRAPRDQLWVGRG